jgi:hypothetical protein
VENIVPRDFVKDTHSRGFFHRETGRTEVVDVAAGQISFRKRYSEVKIEAAAGRRRPLELPAHALLEGFDSRNTGHMKLSFRAARSVQKLAFGGLANALVNTLPARTGSRLEVVRNEPESQVMELDQSAAFHLAQAVLNV